MIRPITRAALAAAALLLAATGCATTTNSHAPQGDPQRVNVDPDDPKATTGQTQARDAAQSYIELSFMSKEGLRKQLRFDKHPAADIDYAIKHIDVDWNHEAEEAAAAYINGGMGMSKEGLREQLRFDGFTKAEADRAIARTWGKH